MSIATTGVVANKRVNCHRAFDIGQAIVSQIIDSNYQNVTLKRKDKVHPLDALTKSIEVEKSLVVVINPLLLF